MHSFYVFIQNTFELDFCGLDMERKDRFGP